jgi:ubiquinone/menaquinone biosynthesis C-methylase UbiE
VLDIGCGGADLAHAIVHWGRAERVPVRVVAVDDHPDVLRSAIRGSTGMPELAFVRADARCLPFAPRSFDVVVASMLLHYFALDEAAGLLQAWAVLAAGGVVVSDVERHVVPYVAARALGAVSRRSAFGEGSQRTILRGFTQKELAALAIAAGLRHVTVQRHFPFRLSLAGRVA